MTIARNLIFACIAAASAAWATDTGLFNYVMPDAKFISGIHVDSAKNSRFGQYVLSQMQSDDQDFQKFINDTQFDPRRDLTDIVVATAGTSDKPSLLVIGSGTFSPAIVTTALTSGATKSNYHGVDLLTHNNGKADGAVAFLDGSTAVMGTLDAVQAAIDRRTAPSVLSADILQKISVLRTTYDAWFFSTGPAGDFFTGKFADPNMQGAMAGNLMKAVQQASGGIRFSASDVRISGEALARSPKDAEALRDVVKFIAGLVQLNRDSTPDAQKVASLVDTLSVTTSGSTMQLSLAIPEDLMEQLFMPAQMHHQPARAKGRKSAAVR